jgi:hypothetical protein
MKNIFLGVCLSLLFPLFAQASDPAFPVTYAEIEVGCRGLSPDFTVTPALNVANKNGEDRVQGLGSASFSVAGNQVVLNTSDEQKIVIGTLASKPTCQVEDAGEPADPSWNAVQISNEVSMELSEGNQATLTVTDLLTQKSYQFSW